MKKLPKLNRLYSKVLFTFAVILIYFICRIFIYFFILGFIVVLLTNKKFNVTEIILYSTVVSISLLITLFGFTKFLRLDMFLFTDFFVVIILFVFFVKANLSTIYLKYDDVFGLICFFLLSYFFLPIYLHQLAPSGADMATHTYTATSIIINHKFPQSYYPIVPIDSFGYMPYGMSVVIAYLTFFSSLPIYKAALLATFMIYPLIGLALFVFLKTYFSAIISLITVLLVLLVEKNWISYIRWGGNPTIFSILLLLSGVAFFIKTYKLKKDFLVILVTSVFFAASFQTHQTPLSTILYSLIPVFFYFFIKRKYQKLVYIILLLIVVGFLALPMLSSIKPLHQESLEHINEFIHASYYGLSPNFPKIFLSIFSLIFNKFGEKFFVVSLIGIVIYFYKKLSSGIYYLWLLALLILLIIDSVYLVSPLSKLFFPDRVISTLLFAAVFFTAVAIENLWQFFKKSFYKANLFVRLVLIFIFSLILLSFVQQIYYSYSIEIPYSSSVDVSITNSDLKMFRWIEKNIPKTAVVDNNYGDGGIWIPAIANRMISYNDVSPQYLGKVREAQKKLKSDYIFVGNKPVYNWAIPFKSENLDKNPQLKLLIQFENARLYKKINYE